MMYQIVFLIINSIGGFFVIDKLFWIIGIAINILTGFFMYKSRKEDKIIGMLLFTSVLLAFFSYIKQFNPNYFYILMNSSALFISLYSMIEKKIFSIVSWGLNGFALGYMVSQLKDLKFGIIIGVVVALIGIKDTFSKKAKDILNP